MKKNNISRICAFLTSLLTAASFTGCGDTASYSGKADNYIETGAGINYDAGGAPAEAAEEEAYNGRYSEKSADNAVQNVAPSADAEYGTVTEGEVEEPYIVTHEPEYNTEEYSAITENEFLSAKEFPLSTFSADVDTASYTISADCSLTDTPFPPMR